MLFWSHKCVQNQGAQLFSLLQKQWCRFFLQSFCRLFCGIPKGRRRNPGQKENGSRIGVGGRQREWGGFVSRGEREKRRMGFLRSSLLLISHPNGSPCSHTHSRLIFHVSACALPFVFLFLGTFMELKKIYWNGDISNFAYTALEKKITFCRHFEKQNIFKTIPCAKLRAKLRIGRILCGFILMKLSLLGWVIYPIAAGGDCPSSLLPPPPPPPPQSKNHPSLPPNNSTTPFPTHEKEGMKGVVGRSDDHYFPWCSYGVSPWVSPRLFSNSNSSGRQDVGKARQYWRNFRLQQKQSNSWK